MNNLKIDNVNFEYGLNFTFICNPKKQLWQSKLSTYSCFHPSKDVLLNWVVLGWSIMNWCRWSCHYVGGVWTYGLNRFFSLAWIVPFNDPQKWMTMPSTRWRWKNIKILSWCLQMFPHCAWMQLQHAHSNVGLWMVYCRWVFWDDMTNVKLTS
jgi:hypothetical protein